MHSLAFHFSYVRHWRALGAIWVLFAVSVAVLQLLVLLHPAWVGSDEGGYFGLYDFCPAIECTWSPFKVRPLSFAFDIAAFLVLAATVLSLLAVFAIMLLVLLRDRYVFLLSSWMHLFAFAAMLGACCVYPYGWDHPRVREVCESQTYKLGLCRLRWPYMLALVLVVDQLTLSLLGFVLACRQPPSFPQTAFGESEQTGLGGACPFLEELVAPPVHDKSDKVPPKVPDLNVTAATDNPPVCCCRNSPVQNIWHFQLFFSIIKERCGLCKK